MRFFAASSYGRYGKYMGMMWGEGRGGPWRSREKPERPADKEVRRANGRRIVRLFRPYWRKLSFVCGLIFVSSALGVVSPFLLREILDTAFQVKPNGDAVVDLPLLTWLAGGMV